MLTIFYFISKRSMDEGEEENEVNQGNEMEGNEIEEGD